MKLELKHPFEITPRLMPGVRVGGASISIEYSNQSGDGGRVRYHYCIDLPSGHEYEAHDIQSGVGGGSLQAGMESLLSFLAACGEGYHYQMAHDHPSENAELFPIEIAEWADLHSDELSMLQYEVQETKDAIKEMD